MQLHVISQKEDTGCRKTKISPGSFDAVFLAKNAVNNVASSEGTPFQEKKWESFIQCSTQFLVFTTTKPKATSAITQSEIRGKMQAVPSTAKYVTSDNNGKTGNRSQV